MVTPLKKRRLANYKEDQENAINEQEETIEPAESPLKAVPNGLKKQILQNLVLEAVLDKAMEDIYNTPTTSATSTTTASATVSTSSEAQDPVPETPAPQTEVKNEVKNEVKSEAVPTIASPIKSNQSSPEAPQPKVLKSLPEPNSAFKSFFTSNVSLEALEAEIAASKKQRESTLISVTEEIKSIKPDESAEVKHEVADEGHANVTSSPTKVEAEESSSTSETKESVIISIEEEKAIAAVQAKIEAAIASTITPKSEVKVPKTETITTSEVKSEDPMPSSSEATPSPVAAPPQVVAAPPLEEPKPKAKKRVSLADYKSLRKVNNSNNSSTCTTPVEATPPPSMISTSLPPLPAPPTRKPVIETAPAGKYWHLSSYWLKQES